MTKKSRNYITGMLYTWLMSLLVMLAGCATQAPMLTTPESLQMAMDNAAHIRTQAKQRVLLLKQAHKQSRVNDAELQSGQEKYDSSKNAFGVWISQLQKDLKSGKAVDNPDNYNILLQHASDQAKAFNAYVDQLLNISVRGDVNANLDAFVNAGMQVMQTVQKIDKQKRLQISSELEALRWPAFDQLA